MNLLYKLSYSQNWNIGFCEQSIETVLSRKKLGEIQWMKHPYKDRWYADPFVISSNDSEIVLFVEEYRFDIRKGILSELHIDRQSKKLLTSFELLRLSTHLSYPAFFYDNNKLYVYPENGESGGLYVYEYDASQHKLINPHLLIREPLADSTICHISDNYYLLATKYPETQQNAYLYQANSVMGPYTQVSASPVLDTLMSRPGGNWISVDEKLYRPAQNCSKRYGGGLKIMLISSINNHYKELEYCSFKPKGWKYNLGLHTINGINNIVVVDGCGYTYPLFGRIINFLLFVKSRIAR